MGTPKGRWVQFRPPTQESVAYFLVSYDEGIIEMVRNERGEVRLFRSRKGAQQAADAYQVKKPGIVGMAKEGLERFQREQRYALED